VIKKEVKEGKALTTQYEDASLTVEAALVMPLFLYFMIAFLYFIQIFTLQEQIQAAITKMGLNMARTAYIYSDFPGVEEAKNIDETIFGTEIDIGLQEFINTVVDGSILKIYAMKYLNNDWINKSCIQSGFDGISFADSKVLSEEDCIDIVVRYSVKIPIKIFSLENMPMIQRVRLRAWTGYEVAATYSMEEENDKPEETIVYVTETGSVYHKSPDCSYLKLSVREIFGLPNDLRNDNGSKYDSCEACCTGKEGNNRTYYITTYGTKYHTIRNCSKIKRNIKEIALSEIGNRPACKRCSD
jgi:hypothetical protein